MDSTGHAAGVGGVGNIPLIERMGLADIVLAWDADASISGKEMSRRLQDEYGARVGASSISRWLARRPDASRLALARRAASDPILRERLAGHVTSDLDMVDHVLQDIFNAYQVPRGVDAMVDLARALFDGLRTKAKLMGLGEPVSQATAVAISVAGGGGRLRDMSDEDLRRLLAVAREQEEAERLASCAGVDDASLGAGGVPEDEGERVAEGGGIQEGRAGAGGGERADEGRRVSTEVRRRVGAGDGNGSPSR